jgi:dTDP-4-amino-4,6-dideoxygalactose transaminase
MSDIQAAIGIHQLRKQERFIDARARYAGLYDEAFADVDEVECPPNTQTGRHCWHLYSLRLNLDRLTITRGELIEELRRRHIGASVHFIPVPLFKVFAPYADQPHNACPRALELYARLVSLPLYPAMSAEQVGYVAESVREILRAHRKTRVVSAANVGVETSDG